MTDKSLPARLQLSRRRGFVLQRESMRLNGLEAVNVARPGRWGNPYPVSEWMPLDLSLRLFAMTVRGLWSPANVEHLTDSRASEVYDAHCAFRKRLCGHSMELARAELRGRNLACFCPLGQACHADVLLEIANS